MPSCSLALLRATITGADQLEPDAAREVANFVRARMNCDGGFRGRDERSDLYYTLFAVGGLVALGEPIPSAEISAWLDRFGDGESLDFVHAVCLLRCRRAVRFARLLEGRGQRFRRGLLQRAVGLAGRRALRLLPTTPSEKKLLQRIEAFRAAGGGYARDASPERSGSIYASYLATLAREDCGAVVAGPEEVCAVVRRLRAPDGGFADAGRPDRGSTPATAAAVVLLNHFEGVADAEAADWLRNRACPSGGFRATPNAPLPDLLSTAAALHALRIVGASLDDLRRATRGYVESLWDESGGFRGSEMDSTADCEYTWYALLALGSLP